MDKAKLLIVEDDDGLRSQLKWGLVQSYQVFLAGDRASAMEIFKRESPAVVILDLGLPPRPAEVEEGFFALTEMLGHDPLCKVIVITGRDDRTHALEAIAQGAYDFLSKPIQLEELQVILRRAVHVYRLEKEHRELQQKLSRDAFERMLGSSLRMVQVFNSIRKVSSTDAPILVVGESGTGKELTAQAIHARSARKEKPFVVINCAAIPANLLESELFGHEKGAFTGAHIQRKGRFELAHEGTLFLDEIGELPLELQVKLLRFLQEHRIERVGGREEIAVDARVIAATSTNLERAMGEGRFREDLYYRLAVVVISLPPLRERNGDLELLAKAFLQRYATEHKKKVTRFSAEALRAMVQYAWPGNIRELDNRIQRAVIMAEGSTINPADLELTSPEDQRDSRGLKAAREALERDLIQRALVSSGGNISRAAAELGVTRPTLYELMEKLGIKR
jgi:two-component system NtrC family response regulator